MRPLRVRLAYDRLPGMKGSGPFTVRALQREALRRAGVEVVGDDGAAPARYDVLHMNCITPRAWRLAKEGRAAGAAVVCHAHTTAEDLARSFTLSDVWSWPARHYLRNVYQVGDVIVTPSFYTRRLLESYGVRQRIEVVSNGVDVDVFAPTAERRARFRARHRVPEDRLLVLGLGLVLRRKGVEDFVGAARQIDAEFFWAGKSFPFPVVFSPSMRWAIRTAPKNVHFLGILDHPDGVAEACAAADVFLFPSFEENQGIVILEAAAAGLPLVLRRIGCYEEWIRPDDNALAFTDRPGLVEALRAVTSDAALRARLANAARKMADEHRLERVGARLRAVYESVARR